MAKKTKDGVEFAEDFAGGPEKPLTKFARGDRSFEHDLFRASTEKMLKNPRAWAPLDVSRIVSLDHTHIYHSVKDNGQVNEYCVPTGGHFHKVTVDWSQKNAAGNGPLVVCGPPLQAKTFKGKGGKGTRKALVPIRWAAEEDPETEEVTQWVVDDHVHEFEYLGSEVLSANRRKSIQDDNKARVGQFMNRAMVDSQASTLNALKSGTYTNSTEGRAQTEPPAGTDVE